MILTDEEIMNALELSNDSYLKDRVFPECRAIESAVLEKLKQQEPVAYTNEAQLGYVISGQHPDIPLAMWSRNTSYAGANIKLYAAPVPAAMPDGWREALEAAKAALLYYKLPLETGLIAPVNGSLSKALDLIDAALSAAPAAPAVPDDVVKDAERYRWLRDRLAIEDIDRLVAEFFGTPDEAESVKTDAAIDAAMQKGGA